MRACGGLGPLKKASSTIHERNHRVFCPIKIKTSHERSHRVHTVTYVHNKIGLSIISNVDTARQFKHIQQSKALVGRTTLCVRDFTQRYTTFQRSSYEIALWLVFRVSWRNGQNGNLLPTKALLNVCLLVLSFIRIYLVNCNNQKIVFLLLL